MGKYSATEQAAVLMDSTIKVADLLGICGEALSVILGVGEGVMEECRNQEGVVFLDDMVRVRALDLVKIYQLLVGIVGDDTKHVQGWFHAMNCELGAIPAELIQCSGGLIRVKEYLFGYNSKL